MSGKRFSPLVAFGCAALLGGLLTACDRSAAPFAPENATLGRAAAEHGPADVNRSLAAARAATARFHNYDKAKEAGLIQRLPFPCIEGQGYHYENLTSSIDGTVSASAPEVLMYEPQKNGQMRLVGVEYIVPIAAWPGNSAPELFGQHFHRNEFLEIYALHVWIWQHNPAGMFADGNPRVSCEHAPVE